MKKILIPHGRLTQISAKTGVSSVTCSKYLKGYYDEDDPLVKSKAEQIRKVALSMGGVMDE